MLTTQPNRNEESERFPSLDDLDGLTVRVARAPTRAEIRSAEKKDIYSLVTERIIDQLEKGVIPWTSSISKQGTPKSLITKKAYRGINPFVLWTAPFDSRYWLTFNQAQKLGGHVRKSEKGSPVVYWHWRSPAELAKLAEKTPHPAPCYPFYATVFNLEQCEGIDAPADDTKTFEHSPIEEAERLIAAMPNAPKFEYIHTDKPSYSALTDTLYIPVARRFETSEDYYCTLFHELGHSTGHESRLNRFTSQKNRSFGSPDYSFEELVAEMTAAFLCAHCGIENQVEQSASYIDGWLEAFRKDRKILIEAASAAQRATDYILGTQEEAEPKE
jgi:antirestriction protein ArdC